MRSVEKAEPVSPETGQVKTAASKSPARIRARRRWWIGLGVLAALAVLAAVGYATRDTWKPPVRQAVLDLLGPADGAAASAGEPVELEEHAGHAPGAESAATSIELSPQAQRNIDLNAVAVEMRPLERTITVPAIVVERPGRTELAVSAPMTGIVTKVHALSGSAVAPGEPLFELRLTHEDLVDKQSQLLRDLEQLDVVKLEIARLDEVTRSGAVAGKTLLERQYDAQRLEAEIRADREALLLHGLSEEQIEGIAKSRRLLGTLTIEVPPTPDGGEGDHPHDEFFQVTSVAVRPGDHVEVGTLLAILSDHCELYIEGKAFENDAPSLIQAAQEGRAVSALFDAESAKHGSQTGLKILYVNDQVERDSRALKFYVLLPNTLVRDEQAADGRRFVSWRYRPGQRVELLIPVERWSESLVVPLAAVIDEGAETYVYRQKGNRFDRVTVHVQYRDRQFVALEADGALFPGDRIAARGAYQIHLALKNKSGGGPDPHAGHHH